MFLAFSALSLQAFGVVPPIAQDRWLAREGCNLIFRLDPATVLFRTRCID